MPYRIIARYFALFVTAISLTALIGFFTGIVRLTKWHPQDVGMALNTAVALLFLSLAVLFLTMKENG